MAEKYVVSIIRDASEITDENMEEVVKEAVMFLVRKEDRAAILDLIMPFKIEEADTDVKGSNTEQPATGR